MLTALALIALGPKTLEGPIAEMADQVRPVNDASIQLLAAPRNFDTQRLVVSEDGKAAFGPSGTTSFATTNLAILPLEEDGKVREYAFWSEEVGGNVTISIRPLFAAPESSAKPIQLSKILWAKSEQNLRVALRSPAGLELPGSSLRVQFQTNANPKVTPEPDDADLIGRDGVSFLSFRRADVGTSGPRSSWWRVSGVEGEFKIGPGVVVVALDSAEKKLLAFTFGEHGSPLNLWFLKVPSGGKSEAIKPEPFLPDFLGRLEAAALSAKGRVFGSFPGFEITGRSARGGLYCADPGESVWRYLGPYRLAGSSISGDWLLLSHREKRESWVVHLKPR